MPKSIDSFIRNYHVKFARRQANEVARALARVTSSLASFHILINVPTCIHNIIIINDMNLHKIVKNIRQFFSQRKINS